jgi:hypothetical protein
MSTNRGWSYFGFEPRRSLAKYDDPGFFADDEAGAVYNGPDLPDDQIGGAMCVTTKFVLKQNINKAMFPYHKALIRRNF